MQAHRNSQIRRLTGVSAVLVSGVLLLAACGPQATPVTTTTTVMPGSGTTPTAAQGVTVDETVSTDSPQGQTTPGGPDAATPGMMNGTTTPGTGTTPSASTTAGTGDDNGGDNDGGDGEDSDNSGPSSDDSDSNP